MDRKQKGKSSENNDRNAERNLAELFAAHNLLQSNPLALLQQQMNVMAQQAGPAFFGQNSNPYNNPAATWLYLDYISRIQAAQQMMPSGMSNNGSNQQPQQQQQQQQQSQSQHARESSAASAAAASAASAGPNPTASSSGSSSRPASKQTKQPSNKKLKLPADTDIIRMSSSSSNQHRTGPHPPVVRTPKVPQPPPPQSHHHSSRSKNQPPKESPPNVQLFKIEDLDAPLNLSKRSSNSAPPKPPSHPLIVKDREPHPTKVNNNNVTIIPHAHTKPENLSAPPGRYPQDFVPKPAHMTKSTVYSHVIPKIPQVGMVTKPNEKLVKKKTTVASLLAQSRVQQQESSATSSRSNSPEANNVDIRSSPTSAPHRPWVNNPAPLVIPSVKKPLQHQQQPLPPPPPQKQKQQQQKRDQQQPQHNKDPEDKHQSRQQTPPQNLSQQQTSSEEDSSNSNASNSSATPADLAEPITKGWKRETLLKGLGVQGLSGEVVYISPNGIKCKQLTEIKKHLTPGLSIKMFSFSSRLLIGDFLLPTNSTEEHSTTLKLSANQLASWLSSEGEENKKEEIRQKEERERKKQHTVLIRALELHRRAKRRQKLQNDRKLRKKAEMMEHQQSTQPPTPLQQLDSIAEIDELNSENALPELMRIKGLRLSSLGFANLLHIYEFLHTFGETLGFDMESLPSMSNLQKAFLHVDENEEELLSVMSHLLVCAVEDPGMSNPSKHITAFGQTLKQADITFGSLSEVLRLFMEGVAESEPEADRFSEWLNEAPFLALSPTRKSTIVAFICDLLLQNKAVLKHLESSSEAAHTARKERQQNDIKVRRLRMLCARKAVAAASETQDKIAAENKVISETPTKSTENEETSSVKDGKDKDTKDPKDDTKDNNKEKEKERETSASPTIPDPSASPSTSTASTATVLPPPPSTPTLPPPAPPEEIDSDEPLEESESDADAKLSVEEIRMKMNQLNNMNEKLKKQMLENFKIIRSSSLGQDRWRRRYWNLPNSGGIYVEGGSTCEFPEIKVLAEEAIADAENSKTEEDEPMDEDESADEAPFEQPKSNLSCSEDKPVDKSDSDKPPEISSDIKPLEENLVDDKASSSDKESHTKEVPGSEEEIRAENGEKLSSTPVQFEVPPPVIKIFSFTSRTGCSGKVIQLIEPVEEPESDDQLFLNKLKDHKDVWEGWWKFSDDLKDEFVEKTCVRGIREKTLRNNLDAAIVQEGEELEDDEIPSEVLSPEQGWDPELSYKVHLQLLESMETLEERVGSASLQVKGWQLPTRRGDSLSESDIIELVKVRLLDLESAIERRYLKPPLGKPINEINLSNLTDMTDGKESNQSHGSRALTNWRDGVNRAKTPGVLSMAIYALDSSIAWDKSVMKASCQLCKGGDNEDKLLLCDACDRGYHTYCFKPPLEQIPDGDWFCWECINKATGIKGCIVCGKQSGGGKLLACDKCVKAFHLDCLNPPLAKAPRGRWHCPDHRKLSPSRKRKSESSGEKTADGITKQQKQNNKKAKTEANWCEKLLEELSGHEDAWPFLDPVNTRQFPTYKKVIKNPMDLATIRSKLSTYKTRENFLQDVRLIFDNCETFNEDDSPVGKAGHSLRIFFESKINCKF